MLATDRVVWSKMSYVISTSNNTDTQSVTWQPSSTRMKLALLTILVDLRVIHVMCRSSLFTSTFT